MPGLAFRGTRQQLSIQRFRDVFQGGMHLAGGGHSVLRRKKILADLEAGDQADAPPVFVHHGQPAKAVFADAGQGLIDRFVATRADHIVFHHVPDPWLHAGDKKRGVESELLQGKINPRVGVATTGGQDVFRARCSLELCVANGGANGVHVGILVADYEGLHVCSTEWTGFGR